MAKTINSIQETSVKSTDIVTSNGTKKSQSERLLKLYIKHGDKGITDNRASKILNIPKNLISARRGDLMKDGKNIISIGVVRDKETNRSNNLYTFIDGNLNATKRKKSNSELVKMIYDLTNRVLKSDNASSHKAIKSINRLINENTTKKDKV